MKLDKAYVDYRTPATRTLAFDIWLKGGLCAEFDATLHEPLSEELLAILNLRSRDVGPLLHSAETKARSQR